MEEARRRSGEAHILLILWAPGIGQSHLYMDAFIELPCFGQFFLWSAFCRNQTVAPLPTNIHSFVSKHEILSHSPWASMEISKLEKIIIKSCVLWEPCCAGKTLWCSRSAYSITPTKSWATARPGRVKTCPLCCFFHNTHVSRPISNQTFFDNESLPSRRLTNVMVANNKEAHLEMSVLELRDIADKSVTGCRKSCCQRDVHTNQALNKCIWSVIIWLKQWEGSLAKGTMAKAISARGAFGEAPLSSFPNCNQSVLAT